MLAVYTDMQDKFCGHSKDIHFIQSQYTKPYRSTQYSEKDSWNTFLEKYYPTYWATWQTDFWKSCSRVIRSLVRSGDCSFTRAWERSFTRAMGMLDEVSCWATDLDDVWFYGREVVMAYYLYEFDVVLLVCVDLGLRRRSICWFNVYDNSEHIVSFVWLPFQLRQMTYSLWLCYRFSAIWDYWKIVLYRCLFDFDENHVLRANMVD